MTVPWKKLIKNLVLGLCSVYQVKRRKDQCKVRIKTANEFVLRIFLALAAWWSEGKKLQAHFFLWAMIWSSEFSYTLWLWKPISEVWEQVSRYHRKSLNCCRWTFASERELTPLIFFFSSLPCVHCINLNSWRKIEYFHLFSSHLQCLLMILNQDL